MSRIPRYNLRSRPHARASSLSTPASEKIPKVSDTFGEVVLNPVFSQTTPAEGPTLTVAENRRPSVPGPVCFYSDVVHASSPGIDIKVEQESNVALDAVSPVTLDDPVNNMTERTAEYATFRTANESIMNSSESSDGDDRPWIQVGRRSRRGKSNPKSEIQGREKLTVEQLQAVNAARKSLTEDESLRLSRREASVNRNNARLMTEHGNLGEGTSKGKGIDPRNWGALSDEEEINLDDQRAALESFRKAKEVAEAVDSPSEGENDGSSDDEDRTQGTARVPEALKPTAREQWLIESAVQRAEKRIRREYDKKLEKELQRTQLPARQARIRDPPEEMSNPIDKLVNKVVNPATKEWERRTTPKAMEPVNQVAPKSYIGQALGRLDKKRPDDGYDSSSSSESSSSSSTSSSSSRDERARERRLKKSAKKRSKSKKTTLKPIAPTTYDGAVDSRAFHRFITEGTAYVNDGNVRSKKKVFVLSHFLKGRAHEFYIREISGDPYRWRLREFFTEMFNYCFPINFRTKQREKLKRCFQNEKPVRDYVYELNELWNMIGDVDERDRVSRLWTGLSTEIQRELWKKELNPETSSFKEVQSAAEIIEIAHSVPMGRDKRSGNREKSVTALTANASSPVRGPRHRGTNPPPKRGRERPVGGKRWGARLPETKSATKGPTVKGISPEERERHRTEGRCFICSELGHVSRQCPKNTHLKSDSPGKPPGIPSFGVHVGTSDEDRMRRLAEVSEPSDDLFVGSVGLFMEGPFEMPSVDPQEDEPSVRFRDPVARRAEDILQGMHFPWDDNRKNEHLVAWNDPDRFWVAKHKKRDWYVIEDYHHHGSGIERMRVSRQRTVLQ
ncbi:hypothetical protein EV424DRAFT_1342894 [Suillus variegatus]|nr:hypothetical protein EV424DRAFT_1342894 [Suillus variegatus]